MKDFTISTKKGKKIHGKLISFPLGKKGINVPNLDIILIHAFPFDSDMFLPNFKEERFKDALDESSIRQGNIRFFLPDMSGFGKSEPFDSNPENLTPYCKIIRLITLEFNIEHLILGGCSMGGYITLEFANQYPTQVDGLILIDTRPSADSEEQKKNRLTHIKNFRRILKNTDDMVNESLYLGGFYSEYKDVRNFVDSLFSKVITEDLIENNPKKSEQVKKIMKKQSMQGVIHALYGMAGRGDNTDVLKRFKGQILIIVGEKDEITPVETAKQMAQIAQDSRLRIIPSAAHLSNWEKPSIFNSILTDWISSILD